MPTNTKSKASKTKVPKTDTPRTRSSAKLPSPIEMKVLYTALKRSPVGADSERLFDATGGGSNISSFYVLLHRMKERGWLVSKPGVDAKDARARNYTATKLGIAAYKRGLEAATEIYKKFRIRG